MFVPSNHNTRQDKTGQDHHRKTIILSFYTCLLLRRRTAQSQDWTIQDKTGQDRHRKTTINIRQSQDRTIIPRQDKTIARQDKTKRPHEHETTTTKDCLFVGNKSKGNGEGKGKGKGKGNKGKSKGNKVKGKDISVRKRGVTISKHVKLVPHDFRGSLNKTR
jgi:hypothetical protein